VLEDGVTGGDAQSVPALLRLGAVRVEDAERQAVGVEGQQPVGAYAQVAVAEANRQVREVADGIREVQYQVVVSERLVLDDVKRWRGTIAIWHRTRMAAMTGSFSWPAQRLIQKPACFC
jgi:hypothetical protein